MKENVDNDVILDELKVVEGITDNEQDDLLNILIQDVVDYLTVYLGIDNIPKKLGFVVRNVARKHFNRLGSLGLQSETVEGHRVDYEKAVNDFAEYDAILNDFKVDDDEDHSDYGQVILI